jgi:hypothetical protein
MEKWLSKTAHPQWNSVQVSGRFLWNAVGISDSLLFLFPFPKQSRPTRNDIWLVHASMNPRIRQLEIPLQGSSSIAQISLNDKLIVNVELHDGSTQLFQFEDRLAPFDHVRLIPFTDEKESVPDLFPEEYNYAKMRFDSQGGTFTCHYDIYDKYSNTIEKTMTVQKHHPNHGFFGLAGDYLLTQGPNSGEDALYAPLNLYNWRAEKVVKEIPIPNELRFIEVEWARGCLPSSGTVFVIQPSKVWLYGIFGQ